MISVFNLSVEQASKRIDVIEKEGFDCFGRYNQETAKQISKFIERYVEKNACLNFRHEIVKNENLQIEAKINT